jgi:uncharacterized membrane protein
LLATLFLYLALESLRPTWLNAVVVAWYATHVYVAVLFTWWTSGLHRLPYLFFLSVAVHGYAKYRWKPTRARFFVIVACFVGAMGFFEKALVIPVVLAGMELCFWREASRRTRRAALALLGTLGVFSALYLILWRHTVGPHWGRIGGGASFLLAYLKLSWVVLLSSASGRVKDGFWPMFAFLASIAVLTVARRRRTALVWGVGLVVVSVCLEVTGISTPRSSLWGFTLPFSHRYYPDVMFVLALFCALACHGSMTLASSEGRHEVARGRDWYGLFGWPAFAAVLGISILSYRTSVGEMSFLYNEQTRIRAYMLNLAVGLDSLRTRRTPPPFVDGAVPAFVNPMGGWVAQHSIFVEALGIKARYVSLGRPAYRVLPNGRVVFRAPR